MQVLFNGSLERDGFELQTFPLFHSNDPTPVQSEYWTYNIFRVLDDYKNIFFMPIIKTKTEEPYCPEKVFETSHKTLGHILQRDTT